MTRGFRFRIAVSTSTGIVRVIIGLGFVVLSKRAVDIATGFTEGNLMLCVAGLIGAIALDLLLSSIGSRTTDLCDADMKNTIQERLFGRILNAEWNGRETFHSGDVLSRLTEDSRVAAESLCRLLPTVVISLFQFLGAFIFLCYFSPLLAVVITVLLPLFILSGKVFFRKTKILTRRIRGIESRLQERMQESLQHRILLLTCNYTLRTMEGISALLGARYSVVSKRTNLTVYSRTAIMTGFQSGYLAAFLWGIAGLRSGAISFGMMTAYLQLAAQIQRPLAELARLFPGLIQSHTAFSRLMEIEKLPSEASVSVSDEGEGKVPMGITFKDVTFTYPGTGRPIFDNFSYTFAPGSRTAIIGETGAGKSTLLRLILGLLKPQQGAIEIFTPDGGESVSGATRRNIIYVPQGNSLLSGTIRRNLLIGKPDATEEELREALHTAAADFVFDLKYGLETPCGEHGDGLSEGQAQRIAIARGLLRTGAILLLDEISASLDETTETLLMQRLTGRRSDHTILMVTHRPTILPYCSHTLHLPPDHDMTSCQG